jgi:xanthine dehydrogenase accessory factor
MLDILKIAVEWLEKTEQCTLAVVAETWGSAPRRTGSLMVIGQGDRFEGSVSGGCVEAAVISEAIALPDGSRHKSLTFQVSTETAWQAGLACGGKIRIELFKFGKEATDPLKCSIEALKNRKSAALTLCKSTTPPRFEKLLLESPLQESDTALSLALTPPPRLIITGAVHIAQALAPMAVSCGYQVRVIDPRGIFTDDRNFPGAEVIEDWPDEVLSNMRIDSSTAVIALTHDPKIDDAALTIALKSDAFYLGALGSTKTHQGRLDRLASEFSAQTLSRIHGPIGLDIGAASPAEIAVSIMAEITQIRRKRHAL